MALTREERARIARENGAKSNGPKTEAGRRRIGAANRKHTDLRVNTSVLDIESLTSFNHLRDAAFAQYRPRNVFEAQYVDEIVDCTWRISRLRACCTNETNVAIRRRRESIDRPINYVDAITEAELDGSSISGAQSIMQRRINSLIANRAMITAELLRVRGVQSIEITQQLLTGKELPIGITNQTPYPDQPDTNPEPDCDH